MGRVLPILIFLALVVLVIGESGGGVDPASIQESVDGIAQSIDSFQPDAPAPDLTPAYNPFENILNGQDTGGDAPGGYMENRNHVEPDFPTFDPTRSRVGQFKIDLPDEVTINVQINEAPGRGPSLDQPLDQPDLDWGNGYSRPNAYISCSDQNCGVNVRSRPSVQGTKECYASWGTGITTGRKQDGWTQVMINAGCNGWVKNDFIGGGV